METITFTVQINAAPSRVWLSLWDDANYRKWTTVFHEGSRYSGTLALGERVYFKGEDESGMFADVIEYVPEQSIVFRHMGELKDGVEQHGTPESEQWVGGTEGYFLRENNSQTELRVELKTVPDFVSYFQETFPKATTILKSIAEE